MAPIQTHHQGKTDQNIRERFLNLDNSVKKIKGFTKGFNYTYSIDINIWWSLVKFLKHMVYFSRMILYCVSDIFWIFTSITLHIPHEWAHENKNKVTI